MPGPKVKLISKKLDKKIFTDIKKLEGRLKAGYPDENPKSSEQDTNGYTAQQKAYAINYSDANFIPYLQISHERNKVKYQKKFKWIAKRPPKQHARLLDDLGSEMVDDIKQSIAENKLSPLLEGPGSIYGSVSFVKVKK